MVVKRRKTVLLTKRFFTEHFYRDLFQLNEIYGPMDKNKDKNKKQNKPSGGPYSGHQKSPI